MVKKRTTQDTLGNPVRRTDPTNITCPVCEQDVDPNNRNAWVLDPLTNRPIHNGCVDRLNQARDTEKSIKL